MDAAQALCPGAAQQFVQHGFRLVVQGVGGGDRIRFAVCHQLAKEGVAEIAGRLLQGFVEGGGGGGRVRAMEMEGQIVGSGQPADKGGVVFGRGFADAVMDVHHGEHDA